ncbi:MAG: 4-hydroxy-tetrahydrodipicolinate synthase [Clostridium sp.]
MSIFEGSGVAIITPFTNDGVDFEKLKELLEWHVAEGTDAIIICGTTGEATTMSEDEKKETIKFTVDVINKRIPVIAGTAGNNTLASVKMSQYAENVGVDGLLIITPYYNKTNPEGLYMHFKTINDGVKTPIVVYNVPSRTGMNISPSALVRIAELSNVVAVKEASGDISQIAAIAALLGDKIDIYSGNDDQIVPIMALGGKGVISVLANVIPNEVSTMCHSFLNGDTKKALELQLKSFELTKKLFIETNPIPVKTALNLMGKEVGELRLPLYKMEDKNLGALKTELKNYNLI